MSDEPLPCSSSSCSSCTRICNVLCTAYPRYLSWVDGSTRTKIQTKHESCKTFCSPSNKPIYWLQKIEYRDQKITLYNLSVYCLKIKIYKVFLEIPGEDLKEVLCGKKSQLQKARWNFNVKATLTQQQFRPKNSFDVSHRSAVHPICQMLNRKCYPLVIPISYKAIYWWFIQTNT